MFAKRFLLFHEKVKTTKVYLRDATLVGAYPLLLFGGKIKVDHARATATCDGWIRFRAAPRVAVLFKNLRKELDATLMRKIADPSLDVDADSAGLVRTIVELLESEETNEAAALAEAERERAEDEATEVEREPPANEKEKTRRARPDDERSMRRFTFWVPSLRASDYGSYVCIELRAHARITNIHEYSPSLASLSLRTCQRGKQRPVDPLVCLRLRRVSADVHLQSRRDPDAAARREQAVRELASLVTVARAVLLRAERRALGHHIRVPTAMTAKRTRRVIGSVIGSDASATSDAAFRVVS